MRRPIRRRVLLVAAPAAVLLGFLPVAARAQLAPPGTASATALRVGDLASVSSTGASASPDTTRARASVLDVGGQPALGLAGSQNGDGDSSGALLDTRSALPLRLELAPWRTTVTGSSGPNRRARASAAAARADAPGLLRAAVLQSQSEASHTSERSQGSGSSDALDLGVLDVARIVLLHSDVSSEGKGQSYLVGVNDTRIGTDEQLGASCALDISPLVAASCLTASGGVGANGVTSGAAELLAAQSALVPVSPLAAFAVETNSGNSSLATPAAAPDTSRTQPAAAAPAEAAGDVVRSLARTGTAAAVRAAIALLALVSGMVLRMAARRRTGVTVH
jgi:hypothetical protein